jgi:hypothetical protein
MIMRRDSISDPINSARPSRPQSKRVEVLKQWAINVMPLRRNDKRAALDSNEAAEQRERPLGCHYTSQ